MSVTAVKPNTELTPASLPAMLQTQLEQASGPWFGSYLRRSHQFQRRPARNVLLQAAHEALSLQKAGVGKGDRLLVACATPAELWVAYLAAIMAGAVPALLPYRPALESPQRSRGRLNQAWRALGPETRLYGSATTQLDGEIATTAIPIGATGEPGHVRFDGLLDPVKAGDPVHLQLSSGSTGDPKVIVVNHGALAANVAGIIRATGVSATDTVVSWLPLYHDMGLVVACVAPLMAGANLYLFSPFDFLRDPLSWVRAISELQATVSCGPDFALREVARRANQLSPAVDLSSWRRLICGAEPINASTLRDFTTALAPFGLDPLCVSPSYGLGEATVYVSTTPVGQPMHRLVVQRDVARLGSVCVYEEGPIAGSSAPSAPDLIEVVALGPIDGVDFRISDPETGETLEEDRCGEIVVSGPSVAAGYLRPDGSVDVFDPTGLPTGDIGFVHHDQLYVVDRRKNVIIRNGENFSAGSLEQALASAAQLGPDRLVIIDSDLRSGFGHIVAVAEAGPDVDASRLLGRLEAGRDQLELPPEVLIVVKAHSLPRTTSGKKQHCAVRELLRDEGLRILARATFGDRTAIPAGAADDRGSADIIDLARLERKDKLLALIERCARQQGAVAPVTPDAHLVADLNIDSLALFELAVHIESEFHVIFSDDALDGLVRVSDLELLTESAVASATQLGQRQVHAPNEVIKAVPAHTGLSDSAARFAEKAPGLHLVIEAQKVRQLLVKGRWLTDWASCNYLGLDLDLEVQAAIAPLVARWGVHPSWTRAVASPEPYGRLEGELAQLVGVADTVVFPTVTLLHFGVLPRLAGSDGAILLDSRVHHSVREAATLARARGSAVSTWRHGDLDNLAERLHAQRHHARRIIAVDGVYSMAGAVADLAGLGQLAARHDATIYVDDAHGLGLLGSRPTAAMPYGHGGNGVVNHLGGNYDRVVYVSGLSKAFSSMAAFVTCTAGVKRDDLEAASTLVFGGPVPVASLATALAGLKINRERGDILRQRIAELTRRLLNGFIDAGFDLAGHSGFPIVNVELGGPDAVLRGLELLWEAGLVVTPSVFPAASLSRGGVRFSVTADNTEDEVDRAIQTMAHVARQLRVGAGA